MTTEVDKPAETPEQVQQQETESNAAFSRGFNAARGAEVKTEAPKVETPKVEESAAPVKSEEPPKKDEWEGVPPIVKAQFDSLQSRLQTVDKHGERLRNMEGVLGGINTQLKTALAAAKAVEKAGGDAPTPEQVKAAATSAERMARMKEDFPDFAEEFAGMKAELASIKGAPPVDVDAKLSEVERKAQERIAQAEAKADARAQESRQLARIDLAHPEWEDTIRSPEYDAWWKTQPADIKALDHSNKASDVIRVLDAYAVHRKKAQAAAEKAAADKARLKNAETPKGVAVTASTLPDEEGFKRGFKRARGG